MYEATNRSLEEKGLEQLVSIIRKFQLLLVKKIKKCLIVDQVAKLRYWENQIN